MRKEARRMRDIYLWKNCLCEYINIAEAEREAKSYLSRISARESENNESNACVCIVCFGGEEGAKEGR